MEGVAAEQEALRLAAPRFLLRDPVTGDESAFVAYQTDPSFDRFHEPEDRGAAAARALFRRFLAWAQERPRRNHQLAVLDHALPDALLGCCGLRSDGLPPGEAEFGIELAPWAQGRHGAALEIARGMLAFGFAELGLLRVRAVTADANAVAGRLAAHLGFRAASGVAAAPAGPGRTGWLLTRDAWPAPRHCGRRGRDNEGKTRWRGA